MTDEESMKSYTDLVKSVESAPEFIEEYGDIVKLIPIAKHVFASYLIAKRVRLRGFLRCLDAASKMLSKEQRKRFDKVISSNAGGRLLAEYVDTILRTSSKTATAAVAVLYADTDDEKRQPRLQDKSSTSIGGHK